MLSDPIADMLTRIRNGYMAKKEKCVVNKSKLNLAVLAILKKYGYIADFTQKNDKNDIFAKITVKLLYKNDKPAITKIKRVSKPGRKVYRKAIHLKPVLSGYGLAIVSTSQGLMTDIEARSKNIGGELFCQVW